MMSAAASMAMSILFAFFIFEFHSYPSKLSYDVAIYILSH